MSAVFAPIQSSPPPFGSLRHGVGGRASGARFLGLLSGVASRLAWRRNSCEPWSRGRAIPATRAWDEAHSAMSGGHKLINYYRWTSSTTPGIMCSRRSMDARHLRSARGEHVRVAFGLTRRRRSEHGIRPEPGARPRLDQRVQHPGRRPQRPAIWIATSTLGLLLLGRRRWRRHRTQDALPE